MVLPVTVGALNKVSERDKSVQHGFFVCFVVILLLLLFCIRETKSFIAVDDEIIIEIQH